MLSEGYGFESRGEKKKVCLCLPLAEQMRPLVSAWPLVEDHEV